MCQKARPSSHCVQLLHSKCAGEAWVSDWGPGMLVNLGGYRKQEGVAAPEPWVSRPGSVCKLPPIVPLLLWSFQCCVPSQLKIRFCLHIGQRAWDPPEKIRRGNRTQSGLQRQERHSLALRGLEARSGKWHFPRVFMFSWGLINNRQTSL